MEIFLMEMKAQWDMWWRDTVGWERMVVVCCSCWSTVLLLFYSHPDSLSSFW